MERLSLLGLMGLLIVLYVAIMMISQEVWVQNHGDLGDLHNVITDRSHIPQWQKEMEQAIPEWQKECRFEDDFISPLYKSSPNKHHDVKLTLVSEFYNQSDSSMEAVRLNMQNNLHHGRFVYVIGDSKKDLDILKSMAPLSEINMEVWYAPGGVTYRHLFAVATMYSGTFIIHNSDISVGNLSIVLDACTDFDNLALFGSRIDFYPDPNTLAGTNCTISMLLGSFDAVITNPKSFDCEILKILSFKHNHWGSENVMASFVPKETKVNLCPRWRFTHYHNVVDRKRPRHARINHPENSFYGTFMNDDVLSGVCDLEKLPAFEPTLPLPEN